VLWLQDSAGNRIVQMLDQGNSTGMLAVFGLYIDTVGGKVVM